MSWAVRDVVRRVTIGAENVLIFGGQDLTTSRLKALEAALAKLDKYKTWLSRQGLSEHSKRAYRGRVHQFLVFLNDGHGDYGKALEDPKERDFAVREYKTYLKRSLKMQPTSVNSALTAIDHFCQYLGMGSTTVKREDLPQVAPRALEPEEQGRFLAAAERCRRKKDRAVALLLFHSGIRIGECVALNVEDVPVNRRSGKVVVRSGKGDRYREVPLNHKARDAVLDWLADRRKKWAESGDAPLFVNPQGGRMTAASVDRIVRKIGKSVGIELSAHILRHSCLTNLVRKGSDLVLVAELGGHKRLETTRRYSLPTMQDRVAAMESLCSD